MLEKSDAPHKNTSSCVPLGFPNYSYWHQTFHKQYKCKAFRKMGLSKANNLVLNKIGLLCCLHFPFLYLLLFKNLVCLIPQGSCCQIFFFLC